MLNEGLDPVSAENIHANNIKRTIRALEYYELTGEPISVHNEREKERTSPYNFSYFVLTDDREKLYARIEDRIDEMMSQGLVDEVRQLKDMGCPCKGMTSIAGTGLQGDSGISGWRMQPGRCGLYLETGYQAFCQETADMVSQRE